MTCAKPISSSTVSPFIRSAVRNAAICASVAVPDMMASIAPAASMRVRSRRSTRTLVASVMIGLVIADSSLIYRRASAGGAQAPRRPAARTTSQGSTEYRISGASALRPAAEQVVVAAGQRDHRAVLRDRLAHLVDGHVDVAEPRALGVVADKGVHPEE